MSVPAAGPLFVRTYYVDSTLPYDEVTVPDLDTGIDKARKFAGEHDVRSAVVMDQLSTVWAQFNLLWSWHGQV